MTWDIDRILAVCALVGVVIAVYRTFRDPDQQAATEIAVLRTQHQALDDRLTKFLTNDWPHMDAAIVDIHHDVSAVKGEVIKLGTIIEERIPKRT